MTNRRTIYLDWDGTLLSAAERLYTLFQDMVPESSLSFDEYWAIKRRRTNQAELLGGMFNYTAEQIATFKAEWLAKVEEPARLAQDTPLPGTTELLANLAQSHTLYVVTARQHPESAQEQATRFGWAPYFTGLLVTKQVGTKADLIRASTTPKPGDLFIGDTGEDIHTARELGITAIAVSSGFLSAEVLQTYNPDFLLSNVTHLHETGLL